MAQDTKYLYETTIPKLVEDKVSEPPQVQGNETVVIHRTTKKAKPIKIALLKPERKLFRGAELFYAKTLANYLKEGLMPYSLVAKRFANDGGSLSDGEKKRIQVLKDTITPLEKQLFDLITENKPENQNQKNELLMEINKITTEINGIQNAYAEIFDSTAEVKTRNDTMEWWSLFLILIDEDGKGYKPFFGNGDYTERYAKLEAIENGDDEFAGEVVKRLSFLVMFWFTAQTNVTAIDMKDMEKLYTQKHSTYKIQEEPEQIKIEDKSDAPA